MADPTPAVLTVGEAMSLSTTPDWPSEFIVCAVERIVVAREAAARADAWDEGYNQGIRDEAGGIANPYRA